MNPWVTAIPRRGPRTSGRSRQELVQSLGMQVVRFQEESAAFDDVAARILALHRSDLACMTLLLYSGAASVEQLTTVLHVPRGAVTATVERLRLAGYARRRPETGEARIELTEHARRWIERIWQPVHEEGDRLLRSYSTRDLDVMSSFMVRAFDVQERQIRRLRKWLQLPSSFAKSPHLRGGLSPAALRRVQLFVEANLERTIHLADL